jgi:hypothetical protein
MPTAKARYLGEGAGEQGFDFSEQLKVKLRKFSPDIGAVPDPYFGHPADVFVEAILGEAWEAKSVLIAQRYDVTRAEGRAELEDLLKILLTSVHKLRNLSPSVGRLLSMSADPLGCADQIEIFAQHASASYEDVERVSKAKKPSEKQSAIATEMAIRVLRILQDYGIPASATRQESVKPASKAVKILKLIGDDLGLVRDELTWRDIVIKAKRAAPDLR